MRTRKLISVRTWGAGAERILTSVCQQQGETSQFDQVKQKFPYGISVCMEVENLSHSLYTRKLDSRSILSSPIHTVQAIQTAKSLSLLNGLVAQVQCRHEGELQFPLCLPPVPITSLVPTKAYTLPNQGQREDTG